MEFKQQNELITARYRLKLKNIRIMAKRYIFLYPKVLYKTHDPTLQQHSQVNQHTRNTYNKEKGF